MSPIITHIYTLVVALLYLLIVSATPIARKANQTHILARGSTTRTITSTPGGFLVKNGQETSCEIALIDNKAAFVAASCVSDANGNTDTSNSYQVYYNSGNSSPVSVSLPPSDISIHAYYNPSTFENNIAIIQFNSDKKVRWSNSIGVGTSGLSDAMLVRRYMSSLNSPEWTDPLTVTNSNAGSSCSTQSGLYAANTGDFVCSYQITEPLLNSMCGIPYGSVYSALNGIVAVSGLYSFSVISGSSFCSSSSTINYYTLLSNYIAFAKNVIGRDVSLVFDEGSALTPTYYIP
ncbi:hypothetical protein BX070DRAFT_47396 [Coemansia spiralis]|nr:hypothetical protein BX070DRAFT_47396 [Coemansia spiralis]